jgi:hypothetical protein
MVYGKPPLPPAPSSPPATASAVVRLASPKEKALRDKDSAECVSRAQQQRHRVEVVEAAEAASTKTRLRSLSPSWTTRCEETVFRDPSPKARRVSLKANIVSVSYEVFTFRPKQFTKR